MSGYYKAVKNSASITYLCVVILTNACDHHKKHIYYIYIYIGQCSRNVRSQISVSHQHQQSVRLYFEVVRANAVNDSCDTLIISFGE